MAIADYLLSVTVTLFLNVSQMTQPETKLKQSWHSTSVHEEVLLISQSLLWRLLHSEHAKLVPEYTHSPSCLLSTFSSWHSCLILLIPSVNPEQIPYDWEMQFPEWLSYDSIFGATWELPSLFLSRWSQSMRNVSHWTGPSFDTLVVPEMQTLNHISTIVESNSSALWGMKLICELSITFLDWWFPGRHLLSAQMFPWKKKHERNSPLPFMGIFTFMYSDLNSKFYCLENLRHIIKARHFHPSSKIAKLM